MARAKSVNTSKSRVSATARRPAPGFAKLMDIFRAHVDSMPRGAASRAAARKRDRLLDDLTMDEAATGIALARGFSKLFTR